MLSSKQDKPVTPSVSTAQESLQMMLLKRPRGKIVDVCRHTVFAGHHRAVQYT